MNRPQNENNASITLCIFPHLKDFVVIDARCDLPGRPAILSLQVRDILGEKFFAGIEGEFSALLRKSDKPFLRLIGVSQEVESLIRTHSLRAILERLNKDLPDQPTDSLASIGLLFFTGPILSMDQNQLHHAGKELFGEQLSDELMQEAINILSSLARDERTAEANSSMANIGDLITGESGAFATIWEKGQDG